MIDLLKKILNVKPMTVAAGAIEKSDSVRAEQGFNAVSERDEDHLEADPFLDEDDRHYIEAESFHVSVYGADDGKEDGDEIPLHPDPRYTYSMWVDTAMEQMIGSKKFAHLGACFRQVEGIMDVCHEDREVFLIKAPRLTPRQVSERLLAAYRRFIAMG